MPRWEVLPGSVGAHVDGSLQQLGELDEQVPALRRARELSGSNQRPLRIHEPLRGLADGVRITLRRGGHRQAGHVQLGTIGYRRFLQLAVDHQQRWTHRRRPADRVGAHCSFGEPFEISRLVVHLHEVANDRAHVLRAMRPIDHARGVAVVSHHGKYGHSIRPRLKQAHRRVQQPDRAMHQRHHGLAGRLGVAMRDRGTRFLVQYRENLGFAVPAVIDDRLMQAFEG